MGARDNDKGYSKKYGTDTIIRSRISKASKSNDIKLTVMSSDGVQQRAMRICTKPASAACLYNLREE